MVGNFVMPRRDRQICGLHISAVGGLRLPLANVSFGRRRRRHRDEHKKVNLIAV